jgi:uncharacterized protein YggU (UPF0235/DUF167 family)
MASRKFRLHDGKRGAALAVRVTPKASKNEVIEIQSDGTVKVRIMGHGNDDLLVYLAQVLGVPRNRVEIIVGESGNDKLISILDMDKDEVTEKLIASLT